uniref:Uncharacterized protein n=1 Tax=Romanomermis culicivorax TaxID=13658 RepID=A0A915HW32_ROMCU
MGDRYNIHSQLEHLQSKYIGTGHADTSRWEWATNIHRDSYASYIGHPDLLSYFAIAENESRIPDRTSNKKSRDSGCQTECLNFSENFAQSSALCDNQSQTDATIWQSNTLIVDCAFVNWSNLNKFLRAVEPLITRTIELNVQQLNIFRSILEVETAEHDDARVRIIHRLKDRDQKFNLEVTSVDWNSSGNVVAACYGNFYHENWCTHKGWLSCWNLQRRTVNAEKSDWCFEFSSCLSCLTFHPSDPALLAVGAYSGEILLFDNNGDIICRTSSDPPKNITCISWSNSDIFAGTSDGRIAVYGLTAGNKLHSPKSFFVPNKHHRLIGRSLRNGQRHA